MLALKLCLKDLGDLSRFFKGCCEYLRTNFSYILLGLAVQVVIGRIYFVRFFNVFKIRHAFKIGLLI